MLLSLFTLSPASKASSFWDLSGRQSGFPKPPKRRREGAGGSPVPYPSALPRRPAHLAPQRGKAISTVLGPKLSGPRGVQWAPWLTSHSQRQSRAGDTVRPAARCLRVGPGGPTEGEEERYWVRGWGALGSVAGSGEAELTQGLRAADRGNGHPMGPGHPRTLALPDSSGSSWHLKVCDRAVQTPGEGRLPRTGNPTRARPERRGRGSQWSGARRSRSHRPGGQSCSQRSRDLTFTSRFSLESAILQITGRPGGARGSCSSRSLPGSSLARSPGGAGQSLVQQRRLRGTQTWPPDGSATRKPQPIPGWDAAPPVPGPGAGSGFD